MLALKNEPITVTLAGRAVQVRKLGFGRMIAISQAAIVADHVSRIQLVTAGLPVAERNATVAAAIAAIPSGVALDLLAGNWAASYDGGVRLLHEAMLQDQPGITIAEVRDLHDRADPGEVYPIACWVSGKNDKPETPKKKRTILQRIFRLPAK